MEHYNCAHCDTSLAGKRYVLRLDQPTCLPCYDSKFADACEACAKPIGTDFKDLSYKGRHWHEQCFNCWNCKASLANQQFVGKDEGLYCPDCYDNLFAQRCDKCNKTFKHGQQKFEYNGKRFHSPCFLCFFCQKPIGNNNFVPRDDDALCCMICYNEKFARKCGKCHDVLNHGGVTFKDEAFHRECFLCTKCNTELAHIKFATKNDIPYCPDCYVKQFSKVCMKCERPIAGLGTAMKYVGFEDKQWHADCFSCTVCNKNLVTQGFLIANGDIACPDCARTM
ncbi:four and a half LIM domains protein 2-like [Watersipora subatra]|uniref:four and a half LIM domains protein 2-like n=1 Tax=Watersipora subatra TaxID=2589382 RepID=UPI00355BF39E